MFSLNLFAQDTNQTKFRIATKPTQFLFYDFPLTLEKVFTNNTLGLTIGYRPSTQQSGEVNGLVDGQGGGYDIQNFGNHLYDAITIGINAKYFLNANKKLFIESQLFYRHWWFDNKYTEYNNDEGYRFQAIRTERQNVFCFKLLFGNTFLFNTKTKLKPIMDLFCGIGLRYKTYVFETFNGTVYETYYIYKKENRNYWLPSLHLGMQVGFGI